MWKYKSQTLISLMGLAVGFTCFALATIWIRYEMTYDSFHKKAKQLYVVYRPSDSNKTGYSRNTVYPLAAYLKETFPEITDAITLSSVRPQQIMVDGISFPALFLQVDSSFFRMFDVKILEGNRDFLISGMSNKKIAITREKALQLFGNENPIGKIVRTGHGSTANEICAIVSAMPKQSNYTCDFIEPLYADLRWQSRTSVNTVIELLSGTNIKALEKKLYEHSTGEQKGNMSKMTMKPITKVRYTDPELQRDIKFQYILIFSFLGLLVIICSLFNYLTLFLSRFRLRQKEFTLRVVCGASGGSLLALLSVEFILVLLFSLIPGSVLTQSIHEYFLSVSNISMNLSATYYESLLYVGAAILVSLFVFWLILLLFRHRSLTASIHRSNKRLSRHISVIVQLIISIGFTFCTVMILKQMYLLHSDEIGFSLPNRGTVWVREKTMSGKGVLVNFLKQIPEITETFEADGTDDLVRPSFMGIITASMWDDMPANANNTGLFTTDVSEEYMRFYNFQLLAGEMLTDHDPSTLVLLNESAVKAFGWQNAVGKHFTDKNNSTNEVTEYTVKGVIKNMYNFSPTVDVSPTIYVIRANEPRSWNVGIDGQRQYVRVALFKYSEGTWKSCKEKIEQMLNDEFTDVDSYAVINSEEQYDRFLKSENALIKLLFFVSAICILICVFGFVSLVSLTLEERRKSIAIRKINGATSEDILTIFAKEYSLLLLIGSVIALSIGYFIMQRWLEQYVKQTGIPVWIYLSILFAMALVIVLCVGWQVWKASVENPSEVVKMN